jgi:DNA-directed RNA polymerase alpha subunit
VLVPFSQAAANVTHPVTDTSSIDVLDIGVRVCNVLRSDRIETINDLTSKSIWEVMRIPNMGKKSGEELRAAMKKAGLLFANERPKEGESK